MSTRPMLPFFSDRAKNGSMGRIQISQNQVQ